LEKPLRVYDRSRTTTDWGCPRRRYYQYEMPADSGGFGIVPKGSPIELFLGTTVHDGLAALAMAVVQNRPELTIDLIARTAYQQVFDAFMQENSGTDEEKVYAQEQATLIEGMLRGFEKYVWPEFLSLYKIEMVEQEFFYYHDREGKPCAAVDADFCFMTKPDLVVSNKEGQLIYVEYKTTSSKKESWTNSWNTAVQLHSTMRAIQQTLGKKPIGVIVQGLYKGYESYGKQSSPFCYAYARRPYPPFDKGEVRYDYAAGFKRTATWELDGGVAKWVEGMPDSVLIEQFPRTPLIFLKDDLVDDFFTQRAIREAEMMTGKEMLDMAENKEEVFKSYLNAFFPQKFDQCVPYFGKPCPYRNLCFGNITQPLAQGFQVREPHHEMEALLWENPIVPKET
jgi:hypothetical protein